MRIITTLIGILCYRILLAQTPGPNELYKKIVSYYQQNPYELEIVRHVHKNVFRYDTTVSNFGYLALNQDEFFIFAIDSTYSITDGLLSSDENYLLQSNSPEKIRIQKNELNGTIYFRLNEIPARQAATFLKLVTRFNLSTSVTLKNDKYSAKTRQGYLEADTSTYRITKVTQTIPYKKDYHQYDEFHYIQLPDSIDRSIKEQIKILTNAAKDFPVTTFKELDKKQIPSENFEGKPFAFKNLFSFNKGPLDSSMKGKYVIVDFFYQACLPCHKMTRYILDWLPSVDSSKIILIGINPADSETSMKAEVEKRNINYAIVLGKQAKEIAKKYTGGHYPTLLLIGPDGTIQITHTGMSKSFLTKAEKIISQ
jgi:thiol-disulfide isomerase/thioredoxin